MFWVYNIIYSVYQPRFYIDHTLDAANQGLFLFHSWWGPVVLVLNTILQSNPCLSTGVDTISIQLNVIYFE